MWFNNIYLKWVVICWYLCIFEECKYDYDKCICDSSRQQSCVYFNQQMPVHNVSLLRFWKVPVTNDDSTTFSIITLYFFQARDIEFCSEGANKWTLVQVMAWRLFGDEALPEPILLNFYDARGCHLRPMGWGGWGKKKHSQLSSAVCVATQVGSDILVRVTFHQTNTTNSSSCAALLWYVPEIESR